MWSIFPIFCRLRCNQIFERVLLLDLFLVYVFFLSPFNETVLDLSNVKVNLRKANHLLAFATGFLLTLPFCFFTNIALVFQITVIFQWKV